MTQYGLTHPLERSAEQYADLTIARVLSQEKGFYRLVSVQGEKWAEVSGKFLYGVQAKSDYPAVGDFVMADWNRNGAARSFIIFCRAKAALFEKRPGKRPRNRWWQPISTRCFCVCL